MGKSALTSHHSLTERQWLFGFFVAAIALWTLALGNLPLRDWDEGYYAILGKEMYRTGNWLYPTYLGTPFFEKPPLLPWLIASSYQLGGIQEWTTRLPAALVSACGVPLLYLVGREVFYEQLSAVFAASVYLTLLPVVRHGRLAMMDGMIVAFFLLLLLCLLKSRNQGWAVGIGISLGLIALTKGILVLLLGAIALAILLAERQLALLKSPYLWLGICLGSAPVVAWYVAQWQQFGAAFLQVHFEAQGFARIGQAVHGNSGPPWYYLLELLKYSCPWLLFLPGGLYRAWQERDTRWGRLVLVGAVGYLGPISLLGSKLPWYILPLYPFFALAVGVQLTQWQSGRNRSPRVLPGILGFLAVAGLGGCVYFVLSDPQPALILMSVVVTMTMGLAAWRVKQQSRTFIPILLVGMYCTLGLLMTSHSWIWELNEAFPVKPVAALVRAHTAPGDVVYTTFAYGRPTLDFYSDRRVLPLDPVAIQKLWATQPYLLLDQPLPLPDSVSLGTAEGFTLVAPKPKVTPSG